MEGRRDGLREESIAKNESRKGLLHRVEVALGTMGAEGNPGKLKAYLASKAKQEL